MNSVISGIYLIRHTASGKVYVGSSVDIANRWRRHRRDLRTGIHHSPLLQRAWDKHGKDAFVFEVVETLNPDLSITVAAEQRWINNLKASNPKYGYNCCSEAGKLTPRIGKGSENSAAKLNESDVTAIYKRIKSGDSHRSIAQDFGVSQGAISAISRGQTWAHLTEAKSLGQRQGSRTNFAKLKEEDILIIKARLLNGESRQKIAQDYSVSCGTIDSIAVGKTWKHICPANIASDCPNPGHKLNAEKVREIKNRIAQGDTNNQIAQDFEVNPEQIRRIRKGERWRNVK